MAHESGVWVGDYESARVLDHVSGNVCDQIELDLPELELHQPGAGGLDTCIVLGCCIGDGSCSREKAGA